MVGKKAAVTSGSTTQLQTTRAPPAPPLKRSRPAAFRPGDFRATRSGPCSSTNPAPPGEKKKEAPAPGPLGRSGRASPCSLPGCPDGREEGARGAGFRVCRTHLPGRGRQRGKGAAGLRPFLPPPLWREPSFPATRPAVSMAPQRPQVSAVPRGPVRAGGSVVPDARREERPPGGDYGYPQPRGWGRGSAFPPLPVPEAVRAVAGEAARGCGAGGSLRASVLAWRAAGARSVC